MIKKNNSNVISVLSVYIFFFSEGDEYDAAFLTHQLLLIIIIILCRWKMLDYSVIQKISEIIFTFSFVSNMIQRNNTSMIAFIVFQ